MSRFFSEKYSALKAYTPGEQPQDRSYIKLNTNESCFPPSPLAVTMADQESGRLQLYSDPDCSVLLDASEACFGLSRDHFIFVNGSDEILNFAFMAFCDKDHPAAFPDITYGFYPVFAQLNQVPYREIPVNTSFELDPSDYCGTNETLFLANPNAPTGIALPISTIETIVASNPERIVVVDEAYTDFYGQSAIQLVDQYDNLLVTRTFSKSRSLAGGRLGIGIANPSLIRDLNTIRFSTNPYNINRMTMAAGAGALIDEAYMHKCVEEIIATREFTAAELRGLGFEMTESKANFLFVRHPAISGYELYVKLKERGILIRHFTIPRISDYNRITIGSREDMCTLVREIREILNGTASGSEN